jgi:hypothetical protein
MEVGGYVLNHLMFSAHMMDFAVHEASAVAYKKAPPEA